MVLFEPGALQVTRTFNKLTCSPNTNLFRFKSMSHPLKEEAVQWQTGFMATPRCFTYRYTLKITVFTLLCHIHKRLNCVFHGITSFRDGNILVTQIQRMGTLLDLVNLTKNSDKYV